jgi:DNA polymerase V
MGYRGDQTTGFQSPAQDFIEAVVDLPALLDLRRPGRYPVRVKGQGFVERGIYDGDILVVDAAADPKPGKVCVVMIGGDVILAVLRRRAGEWLLRPSGADDMPIREDVEVWATVEALVRRDP